MERAIDTNDPEGRHAQSPSEDEIDARDLTEAIEHDDGVRYSTDDVMRIMRESL